MSGDLPDDDLEGDLSAPDGAGEEDLPDEGDGAAGEVLPDDEDETGGPEDDDEASGEPFPEEDGPAGQEPAEGTAAGAERAPGGPAPSDRQVLEALLFTSSLPVSVDRLKGLLGVEDRGEVRALVEELRIDYEAGGRAFQIEEIAGGYVILTRPEYAEWVGRLKGAKEEVRLSRAALETLAIIAYRQPVLRADIEKVRGVGCGPVLRSLLEQGLVRVSGRADLPGSPLLYGTTPRFLREFGLGSLRDLPRDRDL